MIKIGHISANIAGDYRYTTTLTAWLTSNDTVQIIRTETAPVGGMDGPGGTYNLPGDRVAEVQAEPRAVVAAIRQACADDNIITRYGKPTKLWQWFDGGRRLDVGLSVPKARAALQAARR